MQHEVEKPWFFLLLPLLLLFFAGLVAEDIEQERALSLPNLLLLFEVMGLTKGPLFLKMD